MNGKDPIRKNLAIIAVEAISCHAAGCATKKTRK
jgi:hypothetical protein